MNYLLLINQGSTPTPEDQQAWAGLSEEERDNFVKRVYHQSTGYWKPDGEGMEVLAPAEWAAALDLPYEDWTRSAFFDFFNLHSLEETKGDDNLVYRAFAVRRFGASARIVALSTGAAKLVKMAYQ